MNTAQSAAESPTPASAGAVAANDPGLLEIARALWHDLYGLAHEHLLLAALETQRAGRSLVDMIAYGVAAGILLASAWLGLMGTGVLWIIDSGVNPKWALLLVVALNIAAAYVLSMMIRRRSHQLRFPATVGSLKPNAPAIVDEP